MDKNKQEWISTKIKELIRQGKPQHQAIVEAYSTYNNLPKAQEGIDFTMPVFDPRSQMKSPQQNFSPQYQDYLRNLHTPPTLQKPPQNFPIEAPNTASLRPAQQVMPNISGYKFTGNEIDTKPNTDEKPLTQEEYFTRLKLLNPYGDVNVPVSAFTLGESLGYKGENKGWNNLRGVASAGKLALGLTRNVLAGVAGQKSNQDAYNSYLKNQKDATNQYEYYQEGGKVTVADQMTGAYTTDNPNNANVEVEKNEPIKNGETGEITTAVGAKHEDGGIKTNLPDGSKVISNYTQIGAKNAKQYSKDFDIKVKASDTFAQVMNKYKTKIGLTKLLKEEASLIEQVDKQMTKGTQQDTEDLNMQFLSKKLQDLEAQKAPLEEQQKAVFEMIFADQEKIPKKGDSLSILKREGGNIYSDSVMKMSKEYGIQPKRIVELMQEGGVQNQQEETAEGQNSNAQEDQVENLIQAYAQASNQDPQALMAQLQQMSPEQQQQALQQMAQELQSGQEQAEPNQNPEEESQEMMQEGGLYKAQQGAEIDPLVTNSTLISNFEKTPRSIQTLPYTPRETNANVIWQGDNYNNVWKPLVEKSMSDPNQAKKIDDWLMANKDSFSPNIQKQLEGLSGKARYDRIKALATDTKPGLFHNAVLDAMKAVNPVAVEEKAKETTPQKTYGERTLTAMPMLPQDYVMPPSGLMPTKKQEVALGRMTPVKISAEPNLVELGRQTQTAVAGANYLPETQRAAVLAQFLAGQGQQANEAISKAEMFNAQAQGQADQFNIGQRAKEDLTNLQLADTYQTRTLQGMDNYERRLQNYYNKLNNDNRQNFNDISNLSLLNATADNFQTTGNDIISMQNPLNFQVNGNNLGVRGMTPEQQKAYEKKIAEYYAKKDASKV